MRLQSFVGIGALVVGLYTSGVEAQSSDISRQVSLMNTLARLSDECHTDNLLGSSLVDPILWINPRDPVLLVQEARAIQASPQESGYNAVHLVYLEDLVNCVVKKHSI